MKLANGKWKGWRNLSKWQYNFFYNHIHQESAFAVSICIIGWPYLGVTFITRFESSTGELANRKLTRTECWNSGGNWAPQRNWIFSHAIKPSDAWHVLLNFILVLGCARGDPNCYLLDCSRRRCMFVGRLWLGTIGLLLLLSIVEFSHMEDLSRILFN